MHDQWPPYTLFSPPWAFTLPLLCLPGETGTKSFVLTIKLIHDLCNHLQHCYLPSPAIAALLYQACVTLVTLPVPKWQFPHGVSPWVPSLSMPWTGTSLHQPATNLNKPQLMTTKLSNSCHWLNHRPMTWSHQVGHLRMTNLGCVSKWQMNVNPH